MGKVFYVLISCNLFLVANMLYDSSSSVIFTRITGAYPYPCSIHNAPFRTEMGTFLFWYTVYPKKYAHGFCFAVLCCVYTLTDFPISIRLTSLALWQSNDCPSASKATLMNMDKYFMWIHYERLHNHNKAKHNKTVCIFLGIYCINDEFMAINGFIHYTYRKRLWYCDVTQTHIVTSFWPIVLRTRIEIDKMVPCVSPPPSY